MKLDINMGVELPKQLIECDSCKIFTNNEGDGDYWCYHKDSCPGKEEDLQLRDKAYNKRRLSKIISYIGPTEMYPGKLRGRLVATVLNGQWLIGRYLFENETLYFLETNRGGNKHENIRFDDITYIEETNADDANSLQKS